MINTILKNNICNRFVICCFFACLLAGSLTACHKRELLLLKRKKNLISIHTVTKSAPTTTLYYSGTISPLSKTPVISPIEGTVNEVHFDYGAMVEKQQLLFTIKSTGQKSDFQDALTNYLKEKQDLNNSKTKMQTTLALYKDGLVSKDERDDAKNTYFTNQLSFIQAQKTLDRTLKLYGLEDLSSLSLDDFEAVKKALALEQEIGGVKIYSPTDGLALFGKGSGGDNSDDGGDGGGNKIQAGSQIKQGQVLLYIGDVSGLSAQIKINEININNIHVSQKAIITGDSFPNIKLSGYIKSVDTQATIEGDQPIFHALVIVPKITLEQEKIIKMGMSAKVSITLKGESQILIPIDAVSYKNGESTVQVIDPDSGKTNTVTVETGQTTEDSIVITSGLKPGDKIAIPHSIQ